MYVEFVQKVTKGQIHDGSISQNTLYEVYKLYAKCHTFIKKCRIFCYAALLKSILMHAKWQV